MRKREREGRASPACRRAFVSSRANSNTLKPPTPAAANRARIIGRRRCCSGSASRSPSLRGGQSRGSMRRTETEAGAVRRDLLGFGDFEDFDEGNSFPNCTIRLCVPHGCRLRAPSDETGAPIEFRRRVEVADGVHDMVEAVGHSSAAFAVSGRRRLHRCYWGRHEESIEVDPADELSGLFAASGLGESCIHSGSLWNAVHFFSRSASDSQASR